MHCEGMGKEGLSDDCALATCASSHFFFFSDTLFFNTSLFFRCVIPCSACHSLGSQQQHHPTSTSSPASISAKATSRKTWSRRCGMFPSALACSETHDENDKQKSKALTQTISTSGLSLRSLIQMALTGSIRKTVPAVWVYISTRLKCLPSFKPGTLENRDAWALSSATGLRQTCSIVLNPLEREAFLFTIFIWF